MLVIKIELWPCGMKDHKRIIDEIKVINDLTHKRSPEYGNYKVVRGKNLLGYIKNHRREEGRNKLVERVYKEVLLKLK